MKCTTRSELAEGKSLASPGHDFPYNVFVARCYTLHPFFSFIGKLISFSAFLAFTCRSDSMLKREKKELRSFLHRSIFWVISYDQAAVERLEHTLAKLWHTGRLIGQKCPNIEVNWRVDPRFASKRNLSAKKNNVSSEHSSGVAYHPYACINCIFRIIYHSFKAARDISIKWVYKWNALHLPNYQKASLFLRISSLWLCFKTH